MSAPRSVASRGTIRACPVHPVNPVTVLSRLSLRSEPIGTAMQKGRLPDARQLQQLHHDARQPQPESAVGRAAVAEEVEVVRDGVAQARGLRLTSEAFIAMLALGARGDLEALPHQVEAARDLRALLLPHMVEGAER